MGSSELYSRLREKGRIRYSNQTKMPASFSQHPKAAPFTILPNPLKDRNTMADISKYVQDPQPTLMEKSVENNPSCAKEPEVHRQLTRMNHCVDQLYAAVRDTKEAFSTGCSPPNPNPPTQDEADEPERSVLASHLQLTNRRLEEMSNELADLISRCELPREPTNKG